MLEAPATSGSVGIGWRHPHYGGLLEALPPLDFIEVHSENFFAAGGAALAVLRQGRAHYLVSLHGVGLALGSAAGIDNWHLDQLARRVEKIEPIRVSDHASLRAARLQVRVFMQQTCCPFLLTTLRKMCCAPTCSASRSA